MTYWDVFDPLSFMKKGYVMRSVIDLQKKLFPDVLAIMQRRYGILQFVKTMGPLGRRTLAENMNLAERVVRGEIDFLQNQGLIYITTKGVQITEEGLEVHEQLEAFMLEASEIGVLEQRVRETLGIDNCIVVPGNSDTQDWVKQEMGKRCAQLLEGMLHPNYTVAVTGGTTMAALAAAMPPIHTAENVMFVPARGGIGEQVENEANTICAAMAKRARSQYRLLYVPDPIGEESYQTIIEEPSVKEVLSIINRSNVVIHGIGDAMTMAKRRRTPAPLVAKIKSGVAVSEAFGYYFDAEGNVVHRVRTVGLQLEDLDKAEHVIAIAGGASKARAIASYFKLGQNNILVTDEAAANQLIKGY